MKKLILIVILSLSLFLRVYKLGSFPVGFLWDEAALGYNAYSILETARDEYGSFLPMIFKSFGDYKPGLYVYLTVPFVGIFGLNEFAVRLPSTICGTLAVLFLYFLIKESLEDESLALVAAGLLAINPWHINFSRGAWELNVMVFDLLAGLYFLINYINKKNKISFFLSLLFFLISLVTYQASKILLPCLVLGIIFFFRNDIKKIRKNDKIIYISLLLAGYLVFNLFTVFGGKSGRLKVMSLFSYPRSAEETQKILNQDNQNKAVFTVFHQSPIFFLRSFLGRYFNHFSGKFLFISGDWSNPRNGTVYQGMMYILDVVMLGIGLFYLIAKKRKPLDNFMLYWLIIAPIPSALTRDSISAVRSFSMVIPLVFISSYGIIFLINLSKRKLTRRLTITLISFIYLFFLIRYLDLYFVHDPLATSKDRLYGYKQAVSQLLINRKEKEKIIFTNIYGQPYIFYLFYSKYDPRKYQVNANLKENPWGDVGEVTNIDNIEFRKIYFPDDRANKNTLFIGDEFDLPVLDIVDQGNITYIDEIKYLNGKTAFRIVETK